MTYWLNGGNNKTEHNDSDGNRTRKIIIIINIFDFEQLIGILAVIWVFVLRLSSKQFDHNNFHRFLLQLWSQKIRQEIILQNIFSNSISKFLRVSIDYIDIKNNELRFSELRGNFQLFYWLKSSFNANTCH